MDLLIDKGVKKDEAILQVIRQYIIDSKNVRFEGNSYSEEWHKEARKRGLTNITNPVEALEGYLSKKSIQLFKSMKVFTDKELEARTDVRWENYTKKIQIESRVIGDIALGQIVPIAIDYQSKLIENARGMKELFSPAEFKSLASARLELIKRISVHISTIKAKVHEMTEARKVANAIEDTRSRAQSYYSGVLPFLDEIRYHIDKLEEIVDNEVWPLPKYSELLFSR